jgi:hypothetical protein
MSNRAAGFLGLNALLAIAFAPFAGAASITFAVPTTAVAYDEDVIDFGTVGPGQSLEIIASNRAGDMSELKKGAKADWDRLEIVKESLPAGWSAQDGKIYETSFKAFVMASKNARDGEYRFQLLAVDEYEGVNPVAVSARIRVDHRVLGVSVRPGDVTSGLGTPALFLLELDNTASASDSAEIRLSGFPGAAAYAKRVFLHRRAVTRVPVEIAQNEQATRGITFSVTSLSSPRISANVTASLTSRASLFEDLQSAGYGILLFPNTQQAAVGLLAFFANTIYS